MKQAKIIINNTMAGLLSETDSGYVFQYDSDYLNSKDAQAISLTMPLSSTAYSSSVLHPFFDGLIPEGWLLDIVERNWKISPRDRMSLLLACCKDCIGAVSVEPIITDEQ